VKDTNKENICKNVVNGSADRLAYLRKRSLHRLWWGSARVALGREQRNVTLHPPPDFHPSAPTAKYT
jgi:hypothetical protein